MPESPSRFRRFSRWTAWALLIVGFIWLALCLLSPYTVSHPGSRLFNIFPAFQSASWVVGIIFSLAAGLFLLGYAPSKSWIKALAVVIMIVGSVVTFFAGTLPNPVKTIHASRADNNTVGQGGTQEKIRLFAINTLFQRADDTDFNQTITRLNPDLIVVTETSQVEVDAILQNHPDYQLSHQIDPDIGAASGTALLSKIPFTSELSDAVTHQMPRGTFETSQGPLEVWGIHTAPPQANSWADDLARLHDEADSTATTQGIHLIMAGDFNASSAHPGFRKILDGRRDCTATLRGAPTWPAGFPLVRIDHILIPDTFQCGESGTVKVADTDHLGVWADIIVPEGMHLNAPQFQ